MKKSHILIIAIVLIGIASLIGVGVAYEKYRATHFTLSGPAMEPVLKQGSNIAVTPYAQNERPNRGDIVLYKNKNNENVVHRIVGLPGEKVVISDNKLLISNAANQAGFTPDTSTITGPTAGTANITLGSDEYYVLGDNRPNSYDSRMTGPVLLSALTGKVSVSAIQRDSFE